MGRRKVKVFTEKDGYRIYGGGLHIYFDRIAHKIDEQYYMLYRERKLIAKLNKRNYEITNMKEMKL